MSALAFPQRERLRQRERFQQLFRQGRKVECRLFLLLWARGGGARQVGFTLSRQLKGAVRRNRARRRVREAYRLNQSLLPQGIQAVFVVRAAVLTAEFSEILQDIRKGLDAVRSADRSGR